MPARSAVWLDSAKPTCPHLHWRSAWGKWLRFGQQRAAGRRWIDAIGFTVGRAIASIPSKLGCDMRPDSGTFIRAAGDGSRDGFDRHNNSAANCRGLLRLGLATGPAWNTWIGTIVPRSVRARFFSRRSRVSQAWCLQDS